MNDILSVSNSPDSVNLSTEIEQLRHILTLWYIRNAGKSAIIGADLNACTTDQEQLDHLREWVKDVPTWFQIKERCDALPDRPRSRWEAHGVAIERAAAQMGGAK